MIPDVMTFVDVETTGLSPARNRIIEIGMLRMEKGKIVATFESLVNPQTPIPPDITMLTGISATQLEHAPTFYDIQKKIEELLEESIFVAHNARFDYSFLRQEFARLEKTYSATILCTAKLSRYLYPETRHHSLDNIVERFGFHPKVRHRALADATILADMYTRTVREFGKQKIGKAIGLITGQSAIPPSMTRQMIEHLPESPGVYIFRDHSGTPLYIGKSINIKSRVQSHFYNSLQSGKENSLFYTVASVEAIATSGELGALLLESTLIKKHRPLHNRRLLQSTGYIALVKHITAKNYYSVIPTPLIHVSDEDRQLVVAVYKNLKQLRKNIADITREHSLCPKLMGLEKGPGKCFATQLSFCHGACTGDEMPARYNMRFTLAFLNTHLKPWPFPGAVAIRENGRTYILNQWRLEGEAFDLDTYHILTSYLLSKNRDGQISILPFKSPRPEE